MAREVFTKIFLVGVDSDVQLGGQAKQLKDPEAGPSINQITALNVIKNLFHSYYLDVIYPTDLATFSSTNDSD